MLLRSKHKKALEIVAAVVGVLVIASMIIMYSLPALY